MWSRFGDDDGEWVEKEGKGWEGARDVVDGLLRKVSRGRWTIEDLEVFEWVKTGVRVEGGLQRVEAADGGEV